MIVVVVWGKRSILLSSIIMVAVGVKPCRAKRCVDWPGRIGRFVGDRNGGDVMIEWVKGEEDCQF